MEETEVTFLTGSDQSYLVFSWRVHLPILENWKLSWLAPLHWEEAGSFQSEQLKLHLGLAQPVKSLQLLSQNPWLKVWTLFWAEAIGVLLAPEAFEIEVGKGCWSLSLGQTVIGRHRIHQSQPSWEVWLLEIMAYIGMICYLWFASWLLFNHGGLMIWIQRLSWICFLSLESKNDKKLINNISCKIFKCLVVNRTLQTLISKISSCKFPLLFLIIKFSFSPFMIEIILLTVELAVP